MQVGKMVELKVGDEISADNEEVRVNLVLDHTQGLHRAHVTPVGQCHLVRHTQVGRHVYNHVR
jgi:hypothetical protein